MKINFDDIIKEMEKKIEKNLYSSKTMKITDGKLVHAIGSDVREYLGPSRRKEEVEVAPIKKPTEPKPKPHYQPPQPDPQSAKDRDLRWLHTLHDDHAINKPVPKPAKPPVKAKLPKPEKIKEPKIKPPKSQRQEEKRNNPAKPKIVGAYFKKGLWTSQIWCPISKKIIFLGSYNTQEEAAAAYQAAREMVKAGIKIEKPTRPKRKLKVKLKRKGLGIFQRGEKWKARVCIMKNVIHLGTFTTKDDALAARENAITKILQEPDAQAAAQKYKTKEDFL